MPNIKSSKKSVKTDKVQTASNTSHTSRVKNSIKKLEKAIKENDKESIWMEENAYRYGFILRYPKEKENITGYAFEPWHYRYVGIPLSQYLYQNNLTLEEYYD